MDPVKGEPPTIGIANLELAAADLAPHLSLGRIDTAAKTMLGTAGLVGSLVSAFGTLGSTAVERHPGLALPSLILAALSLAFASWAAVGKVDAVQVDDLADVERFYSQQIAVRGKLIRVSGICLGLSVIAAVLPMLACA